ncbi:MAG TPA: carboxylating nicotinate-nucleotide diphosphorylase [Flavobacteriales bacterium]|jgi:nicotinate-nucleotide pyrophosphorylase (carboxylating)|nr:carboxylating nicotinate-nucleotide diphosphorylase [Flavobacteriales bacterium]
MTEDEFIQSAFEEDLGVGDATCNAILDPNLKGRASLKVKGRGILSGLELGKRILKYLDSSLIIETYLSDGQEVTYGDVAFEASGSVTSLLKAERLMLNMMQRMSGIATTTRQYVKEVEGTKAKILDTRKTTPLLRLYEKQAVIHGGGENHRFGLFDMIMIKDNHIDFAGGITPALIKAQEYRETVNPNLKIEIETRSLKEVLEVLKLGLGDRIMLDNFNIGDTRIAVSEIGERFEIESSGGIDLTTVGQYARCGVDYISVGALTHSVKSLDLSFKARI